MVLTALTLRTCKMSRNQAPAPSVTQCVEYNQVALSTVHTDQDLPPSPIDLRGLFATFSTLSGLPNEDAALLLLRTINAILARKLYRS
jgi:hypothetical protein